MCDRSLRPNGASKGQSLFPGVGPSDGWLITLKFCAIGILVIGGICLPISIVQLATKIDKKLDPQRLRLMAEIYSLTPAVVQIS